MRIGSNRETNEVYKITSPQTRSVPSVRRQTWPEQEMAQRTKEVHSFNSKTSQIQLRNCLKWPQPWQIF